MTDPPRGEGEWLRRHRISPRKRWGQNFLIQPPVADGLVRSMRLGPGDPVLEIGPGAGALTRALLGSGRLVHAFEVDARLVALLRERFASELDAGRLDLHGESILAADPSHLGDARAGRVFLAGNLPYAITTPILLWMLANRRTFSGAALLMQREVAERLAAHPGNRTYGSITVWIGYHAGVRRLARVEPGAFWPAPRVDSTLLGFDFHRAPPVDAGEPAWLERVLAVAFGQRRKMLRAVFASALGDPRRAASLLEEAGIDPTRRAESLDLEAFASLARAIGPRLP